MRKESALEAYSEREKKPKGEEGEATKMGKGEINVGKKVQGGQ